MLALALGLGLALLLTRKRFAGAALLEALFMLPLVLPPTVIGFALLHVLGRNGWVGGPLLRWFDISLIFTWPGAVIAATVVALPLVLKASITALEGVDGSWWRRRADAGAAGGGHPDPHRAAAGLAGHPGRLPARVCAGHGEFGASLMVAGSIPGSRRPPRWPSTTPCRRVTTRRPAILVLATSAPDHHHLAHRQPAQPHL